ncbi:NAD-dependent epimerase/dehydratase family protein [Phenylobacterium sp.]|uniref:NAD-dependent epimerase/dehydratase family protein n=1 Tax=Phenylobacterium sp. TaxID=1871053 RepID=UPI001218D01A|nr:NAD-dependent epimerase/dehydratase family protein [Phenylobacterium sp.]THD54260.1 MAG: NAD-dependent epimerase/dehydratase family protein [Phenylobacterium sp.]
MATTRRDHLKLGAGALAGLAMSGAAARAAAERPRKMRILILGGTGFIGPHEVRYALSRGHEVTIFNRGRQKEDWPGPVEELLGDRNTGDLKSLEGRDWDVCIDNPTTLPFWVRDAAKVLKGRIRHYVFISTISVYDKNDAPADETAPVAAYQGPDPMAETAQAVAKNLALYGQLKAVSEAEARRQFGEAATTVIRPGLISGPGDETDRFSYWPVRLANPGGRWGPEVAAPGDGTDPVQFIDARDLAEWIVRMAEQRTAGTFNGTGPAHPMTTKAFLAGVAAGVHATPKLTWIATPFLQAQKVSAWSDMPVWIPGQGETMGFHRRSIARALKAGLTFRPLPVTAGDTLDWFKTRPAERQAKLRSGLTPERETALLAAWKTSKG